MGRPRRNEVLGRVQHVYCRGNRGAPVFEDAGDYAAFTERLFLLASEMKVQVLAFCLMPNHFHLCLKTQRDGASVSRFMQRLNLWHSRQYNFKHGVRGRLNESRYKAKEVDSDCYLLTLVRYIHQNPVRAKLVERVGDWQASSHAAYLGEGNPGVAVSEVLQLCGGVESYRSFVEGEPMRLEDCEAFRFKRRTLPSMPPPGIAADLAGARGEQIRRVFALRRKGRSYREIGRELDCHQSTVGRLLEAGGCREEEAVYLRVA